MKRKFNKIVGLFLSVAMVVLLVPAENNTFSLLNVLASDTTVLTGICGENATWEYDVYSAELKVSGSGDMYGTYRFNKYVKKAIIGEGITSISANAFDSSALESISLPNSLKTIGKEAFWGCQSLKEVSFPATLENIGDLAFEKCTSLEKINVDENNTKFSAEEGILYNKTKTELILYPAGKTVQAFIIPETVSKVGSYAFDFNQYLEELVIHADVTTLGSEEPFVCARALTNIQVDAKNEYYCSVDGSLYSKDKTKLIKYAMGKTEESFEVPDYVNTILSEAFRYSTNLKEVNIPKNVTSIEYGAFDDCDSLEKITILNPSCKINYIISTSEGLSADITLYGYSDSTAKDYADANNIAFEQLEEKEVETISIASLPKKTKFAIDDDFNSYGIAINVNYIDGTSLTRSQGFTIEGFDSSTIGEKELTVSYGGKTTTYNIEVVEKLENETISDGDTKTVDIIEKGQEYLIYFTPEVSGKYDFYSVSDSDTYGVIYDENGNTLYENDDSDAGDGNFSMSYELEAGKTYIFASKFLDEEQLGSFEVILKLSNDGETEQPSTPEQTTPEATTNPEETTTKVPTTKPQTTTKPQVTTKKITVKNTKVKKASKKKSSKKAKITLKKIKGVTGYEVKISTSSKFKKSKTITKKFKKASFTFKSSKIKNKKKLYVKARAYKKVKGRTHYSKWSKKKKITIKK